MQEKDSSGRGKIEPKLEKDNSYQPQNPAASPKQPTHSKTPSPRLQSGEEDPAKKPNQERSGKFPDEQTEQKIAKVQSPVDKSKETAVVGPSSDTHCPMEVDDEIDNVIGIKSLPHTSQALIEKSGNYCQLLSFT